MKIRCDCGTEFDFDTNLLDQETWEGNPNVKIICADCGSKRVIELCKHRFILYSQVMLCYKCGFKKPTIFRMPSDGILSERQLVAIGVK